MSKLKSEIRASVLNDIGSRIEDVLDAAKKELASFQGGKQALLMGRQKIEAHMAYVDKDVESGVLDLQQSSLVKKYLTQCSRILENLAIQLEVQGHQAQGKIIATENLVKVTKTLFDQETAKMAEPGEDDQDGNRPPTRVVGQRPDNVIADRKAEVKASSPKGKRGAKSI